MSIQELKNIFTPLSPSIPTLIPYLDLYLGLDLDSQSDLQSPSPRSIHSPKTLPNNVDELGKNGNSKNQINTRKCLVSIARGCL